MACILKAAASDYSPLRNRPGLAEPGMKAYPYKVQLHWHIIQAVASHAGYAEGARMKN